VNKDGNKEEREFFERNHAKGYVHADGSLSAGFDTATLPIRNYQIELTFAVDPLHIGPTRFKTTFFSSAEGTTLVKPLSAREEKYEIELLTSVAAREEALRRELGLKYFQFSDEPFSYEYDENTADWLLDLGQSTHFSAFRSLVRSLGADFAHLAEVMSITHIDDCSRFWVSKEDGSGLDFYITASPLTGVMIKRLTKHNTKVLYMRFERLAEQSLWDYFTDF